MTGAIDREVRQDVADVLIRYATGIDSRDWDLFRSCFTEDCEVDYGDIGVWHSAAEVTGWMRDVHEACGWKIARRRFTAVLIQLFPEGTGLELTRRSEGPPRIVVHPNDAVS